MENEINNTDYEEILTFGIVITGGGSKLNNIADLAMEGFQEEVKLGRPHSINGLNDIIDNPRYATTIGLIKYVGKNFEDYNKHKNSFIKKIKSFLKELINN